MVSEFRPALLAEEISITRVRRDREPPQSHKAA